MVYIVNILFLKRFTPSLFRFTFPYLMTTFFCDGIEERVRYYTNIEIIDVVCSDI